MHARRTGWPGGARRVACGGQRGGRDPAYHRPVRCRCRCQPAAAAEPMAYRGAVSTLAARRPVPDCAIFGSLRYDSCHGVPEADSERGAIYCMLMAYGRRSICMSMRLCVSQMFMVLRFAAGRNLEMR